MIKASIVGGAGYTAGELIRILINHPEVEIISVSSTSHNDEKVRTVHPDLLGCELVFCTTPNLDVDIIFLCTGHGKAKAFIESHLIPESVKIIDLSQDFRWQTNNSLGNRKFIYGLPEANKEAIQTAGNIANPGCFATCIQLGLLPLAAANKLPENIVINAITGSTGAGQSPSATTHFSWRMNNLSAYKVFEHQHLVEIGETLTTLQPDNNFDVSFIPIRGDFSRGIFATIFMKTEMAKEILQELYAAYYSEHSFTHLSDEALHLKQVVNTNNALISIEKLQDKLLITTVIDNLLKGASGQAVQNMNLMFGLDETTGLQLKGSIF